MQKRLDRGVDGGEEGALVEVIAEADVYDLLAQRAVGTSELEVDP
jgi:hypothetical protein